MRDDAQHADTGAMDEKKAPEGTCRHCGRLIWDMGEYRGWVHADSWVSVCDTSTHGPYAEPEQIDGQDA